MKQKESKNSPEFAPELANNLQEPKKLHRFTKGISGNPRGREKGSRNKLGEHYLAALHADFEKHGVKVIERVREDCPDVYLKLVSQLIPKDVNLNVSASESFVEILKFMNGQGGSSDAVH